MINIILSDEFDTSTVEFPIYIEYIDQAYGQIVEEEEILEVIAVEEIKEEQLFLEVGEGKPPRVKI